LNVAIALEAAGSRQRCVRTSRWALAPACSWATEGASVFSNRALLVNNARLAGLLATALV
jgi:hypothetical protein